MSASALNPRAKIVFGAIFPRASEYLMQVKAGMSGSEEEVSIAEKRITKLVTEAVENISSLVVEPSMDEAELNAFLDINFETIFSSPPFHGLDNQVLEGQRRHLDQVLREPALEFLEKLGGKGKMQKNPRCRADLDNSTPPNDGQTLTNAVTMKLFNERVLKRPPIRPILDKSSIQRGQECASRLRKDITNLLHLKLTSMFEQQNVQVQTLIDRVEKLIPYCYMRDGDDPAYVFQFLDYVKLNYVNHLSSLGQESRAEEPDENLEELDTAAYKFRAMVIEVEHENSKHEPINRPFYDWLKRYEQNLPEQKHRRLSDVIFYMFCFLMPSPVHHYWMLQSIPKVVLPKMVKEVKQVTTAFEKVAPHQDTLCRIDVLPIHQEIGNMAASIFDAGFPTTGVTFRFLEEYAAKRVSVGKIYYDSPSSIHLGTKATASRMDAELPMREELIAIRAKVQRLMVQELEARKSAVPTPPPHVNAVQVDQKQQKQTSYQKQSQQQRKKRSSSNSNNNHLKLTLLAKKARNLTNGIANRSAVIRNAPSVVNRQTDIHYVQLTMTNSSNRTSYGQQMVQPAQAMSRSSPMPLSRCTVILTLVWEACSST